MINSPTGGILAGFFTLCSIAVGGLYLVAIVASAVSSSAPFDPWQTIPLVAFVAFIIMGALLGGGAVTWSELSSQRHIWTPRIALALFLVVTMIAVPTGILFMVLIPPVFVLTAVVLSVIVARRQFGASMR